jgi:hypothetical protein
MFQQDEGKKCTRNSFWFNEEIMRYSFSAFMHFLNNNFLNVLCQIINKNTKTSIIAVQHFRTQIYVCRTIEWTWNCSLGPSYETDEARSFPERLTIGAIRRH